MKNKVLSQSLVTTPEGTSVFSKMKEPATSHIKCTATIKVVDAETGDVSFQADKVLNIKKKALDELGLLTSSAGMSVFNSSLGFEDFFGVNEVQLIMDPTDTETALYNVDEGHVVGYALTDADYGGQDDDRGNRNVSLSGTSIDPINGDIINNFAIIFDETRINDQPFNKLALVSNKSNKALGNDGSANDDNAAMAGFVFNSHRWMTDYDSANSYELNIAEDVWYTDLNGWSKRAMGSHNAAYKNMLIALRQDDAACRYRALDISSVSDGSGFTNANATDFNLPLTDDVAITDNTASFFDAVNDAFYHVTVTNGKLVIHDYIAGNLTGVLVLREKLELNTGIDILSSSPVGLTIREGLLEVFVTDIQNRLVRIRVTATNTLDITQSTIPVNVYNLTHVKDEIYLAVTNVHYKPVGTSSTSLKEQGGYIDLSTGRFIHTFTAGNSEDGAQSTYAGNGTILPTGGRTSNKTLVLFCPYTGRIFNYEVDRWMIAVPVETHAPRQYLHVDTIPETVKDASKQIQINFEIRTPSQLNTISNPFDKIANMPNDTSLFQSQRYRDKYKILGQDPRILNHIPNDSIRDSKLDGYVFLLGPKPASYVSFALSDGGQGKQVLTGDCYVNEVFGTHDLELDRPNGSGMNMYLDAGEKLEGLKGRSLTINPISADNLINFRWYTECMATKVAIQEGGSSSKSHTGAISPHMATFYGVPARRLLTMDKNKFLCKGQTRDVPVELDLKVGQYLYVKVLDRGATGFFDVQLTWKDGNMVDQELLLEIPDDFDFANHSITSSWNYPNTGFSPSRYAGVTAAGSSVTRASASTAGYVLDIDVHLGDNTFTQAYPNAEYNTDLDIMKLLSIKVTAVA